MKLVRESLNEFHQTGDPLKSLELGKYSNFVFKVKNILLECLHEMSITNPRYKNIEKEVTFIYSNNWIVIHFPDTYHNVSSVLHECLNFSRDINAYSYYDRIRDILDKENLWCSVNLTYLNVDISQKMINMGLDTKNIYLIYFNK